MPETPEEKLLRIIESPTRSGKKNRSAAVGGGKFSLKDLYKKLLRWNGKKILKSFNLAVVNKAFAVLCMVGSGFFAFDFFHQGNVFDKKIINLEKGGLNPLGWAAYVPVLKVDKDKIIERIKEKNMFSLVKPEPEPVVPVDENNNPVPVPQQVVNYTPVLQDLSLVGIIWAEVNPQAIIEDTVKEKTYLLSIGDIIEVFTVKTITEDSVVLDKSGNEWILR